MKKLKVYVGATLRWDFTTEWQAYVNLAKRFGCRFNPDDKCWIIPNFATAVSLVKELLQVKPADEIVVTDFETFVPVPAGHYITLDYQRERRGLGKRLPLQCTIEGEDVYLSMPLDDHSEPALDHAVYHGLATLGCNGAWIKDKGFLLKENAREAVDFLVRDAKVPISGMPKISEEPFVCDLYDRLLPHQTEGVSFLYHRRAAVLGDDMGLGKTFQSIVAAEGVRLDGMADGLIIICPVSLVGNWQKELQQWGTGYRCISIVPYSQLKKLDDVIRDMKKTSTRFVVIADEAHYLKTPTSQRTKDFTNFVQDNRTVITAIWLLTGTPVTRDFSNLWPLCYLMSHPIADKYRPSEMVNMTNKGILRLSGGLRTHMLVRKKSDVLNLPPKIRGFKEITTGADFLNELILREIAYGKDETALEHIMTLKRLTAEAKVEETINVARQVLNEGRKVVIFSDHTAAVESFSREFGSMAVLIDGSVAAGKRTALVERFQTDNGCRVFIGNIKAAGVGLTLTASQDVIFNDLTWLPADVHQAEDRCHRIGVTGTVNVWYMADRNLILDEILARKLAERSAEIATFEQSKQSALKEMREWARGQLAKTKKAVNA